MSPAHGRPPSDNPKGNTFQMRLSDRDLAILDKCRDTYGFSKSATLLFGLQPLAFAAQNKEFRQLLDALIILKQLEDLYNKNPSYDNLTFLNKQVRQVRFNFEEFLQAYEKK